MREAHMENIKDIEEREGKSLLRRPRRGWWDNTKVYLTGYSVMYWTNVVQCCNQ